ncbi:MAG: hypothetical protein WDN75_20460 [Bacteroidota bacterium]
MKNNRSRVQKTITYFNNAPEDLKYIWLQLDQNINADGSMTKKTSPWNDPGFYSAKTLGNNGRLL